MKNLEILIINITKFGIYIYLIIPVFKTYYIHKKFKIQMAMTVSNSIEFWRLPVLSELTSTIWK